MAALKDAFFGTVQTTMPGVDMRVRVCAWAIVRGEMERFSGTSVESLLEFFKNNPGIYFFHNLAFDFPAIHYPLFVAGEKVDILEKKDAIYRVKFWGVELRDSMNFLDMPLQDIADAFAPGRTVSPGGSVLPYERDTTIEDLDGAINDAEILMAGMKDFYAEMRDAWNDAGAKKTAQTIGRKLTTSGIAWAAVKELTAFEKLCPKTTYAEWKAFQPAFRGGYVYSDQRGIVENVRMIDYNSMYRTRYTVDALPIGKPFFTYDEQEIERYPASIRHLWVKFELKEGGFPVICESFGRYGQTHFYKSSGGEFMELTLSNVDIDLMRDNYNTEEHFHWGAGFHVTTGLFDGFSEVIERMSRKASGKTKKIAKKMGNAAFGKLAASGLNEKYTYRINPANGVLERQLAGWALNDEGFRYFPGAIQIAAGARRELLSVAQKIGRKNIHYMDTDSIKFSGDIPQDLNVHPTRAGAWKDEGTATLFKTIGPKKYADYTDGVLKFTVSGIPKIALKKAFNHSKTTTETEARIFMNAFHAGTTVEMLQARLTTGGMYYATIKKEFN